MIVLIVGEPLSGKTTALKVLKKIGFSTASTGDVIRDEIKNRNLPYTKENDAKIAEWFHKDNREILLIKRLLKKVKGDKIAIEGLRSPIQLKELERKTDVRPIIIAIKADFKTRLKRMKERKRFPGEDEKYLRKREEREARHGEMEFIKMADYTIDNTNLSLKEFEQKVRDIVKRILLTY